MPSGSGMKEVSIAPRVGAAVAAGVEETGAFAGTKELSGGERFGLNLLALNIESRCIQNLQGKRTCGIILRPRRKKSLAGEDRSS